MNSENSKTSFLPSLVLSLADKRDFIRDYRCFALSDVSIYYTWKNIKKSCKNNKFQLSRPTTDEEVHLSDGSFSLFGIQNYFVHIIKKHEKLTNNRIAIKIKTSYCLELLTSEKIKLLVRIKKRIMKDNNGENFPWLEVTELVLVHCNLLNNSYQHAQEFCINSHLIYHLEA